MSWMKWFGGWLKRGLGMGGTHPWGYGTYGVFTENHLQPSRWAMGWMHRTHVHEKAGLACLTA